MPDDELFGDDELDPKIPLDLEEDDDLFMGDEDEEEDDDEDLDALGFTKEDEDLF
jgi:hypothetical protein